MSTTQVLIVEDEKIIALDLKLRIKEMGFKVLGAVTNGADALEIALNKPVDLVLMDVNIEGDINGIETARIIKESKDVPIIFITAYVDEVTFNKASESEPYAFIVKPFDERDLHFTIRTVLQQYKLKQKLAESEAQYRRLFENSRQGLLILDNNADILDSNITTKNLWSKISSNEFEPNSWFQFFDARDQALIKHKWSRFLKKGYSNGKFTRVLNNGDTEYFDYSIESNFQEGQHLCTVRNISNLINTRKKVDYLATLQQESPMPAYRTSTQGEIQYANRAGEELQKEWWPHKPEFLPDSLLHALAQQTDKNEIITSFKLKHRTYSVRMVAMKGFEYINVYFTDVSDVRLAEKVNNLHKDLLEMIARGINSRTVMEQVCLRIKQFMPSASIGIFITVNNGRTYTAGINSDVDPEIFEALIQHPASDNNPLTKAAITQSYLILKSQEITESKSLANSLKKIGIEENIFVPIRNEMRELIAVLAIFNVEKSQHNVTEQNLLLSTAKVISLAFSRDAVLTNLYKQSLVFANMYDAIILVNNEGRITDWNPSSEKMFGLAAHDVLSEKLSDLTIFDKPAKLFKLLKYADSSQFDNNQKFIDELSYTHKTGTVGIAELSVVSLNTLYERQGTLIVVRDITARKHFETALTTSEANLISLVENTPDIIFSLNTKLKFITFNNACTALYKNFGKDSISAGDSFYTELMPNATIRLTRHFNQALLGERVNIEIPIHLDKLRYFDLSANPISTPEGIISGISIFARDITERKEFENELRKTNFELDSFVYRASHDLRAPLRSVLGLAGIIRMEVNVEKRDNYLELIVKSINKLDKFISDLTDFSRNTRLAITIEEVDFKEIVHENMENLKFMEGASKIQLKLDINQECPLYTDLPRLHIVLQNMLSNAIKYQSYDRESYLAIVLKVTEYQIQLVISDNGKGIKIEYLRKIFNMFFRASEDSYGSGLGLYITKQVIERLGGTIVVSSDYNKGTTFSINIPNMTQEYKEQLLQAELENNQNQNPIIENNDGFFLA